MNDTHTTALDIYEAIPLSGLELVPSRPTLIHNDIEVRIHDDYPTELSVRLTAPINHPESERLFELAKDLLETYLSETTNNDACEVRLTEKSAHHDEGPDRVEVLAELLDWLT
jgi:hypothetical protein